MKRLRVGEAYDGNIERERKFSHYCRAIPVANCRKEHRWRCLNARARIIMPNRTINQTPTLHIRFYPRKSDSHVYLTKPKILQRAERELTKRLTLRLWGRAWVRMVGSNMSACKFRC